MSVADLIRSDFRRYMATGARRPLRLILFTQGLWASCVYRVCHHLFYRTRIPLLRSAVRFGCQVARKWMEIITGISLPPECFIGPGLYIGHFGNIIISPEVRIGSNCNLAQGITLGYGGRGEKGGYPTLGNRVYIAANAVVVGKITIGDDAVIGAGAVVTKPVPPRAVVAGNPSRIISYRGSFDFVLYDGMEHDPDRQAALESQSPDAGSTTSDEPGA